MGPRKGSRQPKDGPAKPGRALPVFWWLQRRPKMLQMSPLKGPRWPKLAPTYSKRTQHVSLEAFGACFWRPFIPFWGASNYFSGQRGPGNGLAGPRDGGQAMLAIDLQGSAGAPGGSKFLRSFLHLFWRSSQGGWGQFQGPLGVPGFSARSFTCFGGNLKVVGGSSRSPRGFQDSLLVPSPASEVNTTAIAYSSL